MGRMRKWRKGPKPVTGESLGGAQIAKIVSKRTGIRLADVEIMLGETWGVLLGALGRGDGITIKGVGKFVPEAFAPSLEWNETSGSYAVVQKGREFHFTAAKERAQALADAFSAAHPATLADVLEDSTLQRIEGLLTMAERRAGRGDHVDPAHLLELRRAKEKAQKKAAPPEGDAT